MHHYLDDIKKYDSYPDEAAVDRLAQRLSLVMQDPDSALVAALDPEEVKRVEKNWAQDKLGASASESKHAVAAVADMMKAEKNKNRVTFYYLVAKELGVLDKI